MRRLGRSRRCWSSRHATRPRASATRRGRRTTASRKVSRRASSPRSAGRAGDRSCRGQLASPAARSRRVGAAARSRSSRSRGRRRRRMPWPGSSAGRPVIPRPPPDLEPADVLVDAMRGRSTTWTRIRVNLEHVARGQRPAQEPLDPDYDPWVEWQASRPADRTAAAEAGALEDASSAPTGRRPAEEVPMSDRLRTDAGHPGRPGYRRPACAARRPDRRGWRMTIQRTRRRTAPSGRRGPGAPGHLEHQRRPVDLGRPWSQHRALPVPGRRRGPVAHLRRSADALVRGPQPGRGGVSGSVRRTFGSADASAPEVAPAHEHGEEDEQVADQHDRGHGHG